MAIDSGAYSYLFDPIFQVESIAGKPCVGGHIEVYKSGTDEKVITLNDWDGTCNPFRIPLGSDGRAVILVDIGYTYDAYIYDSFNNLICSRLNIIPLSTGDITVQGLTKVYHDSATLSGDGTPQNPLKVIGGGGGGLSTVITQWPVTGDGSSADPVTINDLTLFAHDDTLTSYDAEIEGKKSLVLGVNGDWFESATSGFQEKSDMSNYVTNQTFIDNNNYLNSKIDTKLDTTAFSEVSGSFLTAHQSLDGYATETWVSAKGYAYSSDIPTNVSQLNNDAGYLTEHQSLTAYALKSEIPVIGTIEV